MCNGSIMDKLISFALPLMLSGILQLMFNAVDIVVVGRFSGSQSLAAVGSTTALINVFTNLFIGISLGTNVLAARFYGAGKTKEMSETVHTSIALALISWPKYSRIARSQTLSMKSLPYMQAAQLAGDSALQMILRHVLPNIVGPILVTSMLDIGTMMMEIAGLSFLGLGAQPPVAEWGSMMSSGRSMLQTYPWIVLSPGLAIFVSVVIFNLLGDTIRDYMDPKNSHSR